MHSTNTSHSSYPRFVKRHLVRKLAWSPVVLLTGPRQTGKTTLCKAIQLDLSADGLRYEYYTLDDQATLEYAKDDPVGFVDQLPEHVILDEVQFAPDIFRPLKKSVDDHRIPGRFLLTCSTQLSLVAGLADALVGRVAIETIYPLSQRELNAFSTRSARSYFDLWDTDNLKSQSGTQSFLQDLLEGRVSTEFVQLPRLSRELAQRIVVGGYPVPQMLDPSARREWHQDYIRTISQRDIQQMSSVRRIDLIPEIARVAASKTSRLLNLSAMEQSLELSRNTVNDYVSLLQAFYVLQRIPSWTNKRLRRTVRSPKLHFVDTGLACSLLNLDADALWKDRELFRRLAKSFVVQEIVKQLSWQDRTNLLFHYRDRDGVELDIVIETGNLAIVAIDVSTRASVRKSDFSGIRKLKEASEKFIAGVVLYDGEIARSIDENLYAVPISKLWDV